MFQRLEAAIGENRLLKSDLSDTKTSIALLKAELAQTRSQYESKCSELSMERENRMEHMYELDNLHRQLNLLQSANQKLQARTTLLTWTRISLKLSKFLDKMRPLFKLEYLYNGLR